MTSRTTQNELEYIPNKLVENLEIENLGTKIYRRRWINLFVFFSFGIVSSLHYLQIIIIKNILCRYYDVSEFLFNWTMIIFSAAYIFLLPPVLYLLNKKGLKIVCLIGAICACLGCWIKMISAFFGRFDILFAGQLLAACAWTISIIVPPHLASRWFEHNKISFATSIGQMSNNIGLIISQTSSLLVKNSDNLENIREDLYTLFLGIAIPSTCIMIFMMFFFVSEPKIPPTKTRAFQELHRNRNEPFWKSVTRILKNVNYLMLLNSFGLHMLVTGGIFTFLNPFYMAHFKNGEKTVGLIGMTMLISGTVMDIALGILQDKIREFKKLILIVTGLAIISQILYAFALHAEIEWLLYISAIFIGFFVIGYITVASQTCIEITYPEQEGITTAILTMSHRLYELIFLPILSRIMEYYGEIAVHVFLLCALIISFIITSINKDVQKRQILANHLDNKTDPAHMTELKLLKPKESGYMEEKHRIS